MLEPRRPQPSPLASPIHVRQILGVPAIRLPPESPALTGAQCGAMFGWSGDGHAVAPRLTSCQQGLCSHAQASWQAANILLLTCRRPGGRSAIRTCPTCFGPRVSPPPRKGCCIPYDTSRAGDRLVPAFLCPRTPATLRLKGSGEEDRRALSPPSRSSGVRPQERYQPRRHGRPNVRTKLVPLALETRGRV